MSLKSKLIVLLSVLFILSGCGKESKCTKIAEGTIKTIHYIPRGGFCGEVSKTIVEFENGASVVLGRGHYSFPSKDVCIYYCSPTFNQLDYYKIVNKFEEESNGQ